MRREPGHWLRIQYLKQYLKKGLEAVFGFAVLGGLIAGILLQSLSQKLWPDWATVITLGVSVLAAVCFYWLQKGRSQKGRWQLDNLKKGQLAETQVGNAIDYAVTAPGCAVAHDVMDADIAKRGNIDHIVATPKRIWVIETKSSQIPKKKFPRALSGIAANVKTVRKWARLQTEVRGCLVIDSTNQRSSKRKADGEEIWVESRRSLVNKLKMEVHEAGPPDSGAKELTQRVWALGKLDD